MHCSNICLDMAQEEMQKAMKLDVLPSNEVLEELPAEFILPEDSRATLPHDGFDPELQIPVLDLLEDADILAAKIGDACREWSFFQVKNHGVPEKLVEEMVQASHNFFQLPTEVKELAKGANRFRGYGGNAKHFSHTPYRQWQEAFGTTAFPTSDVADLLHSVYPDDAIRQKICDTFTQYGSHMKSLASTIVSLLTRSLDLPINTYAKQFTPGGANLRINYYPPCPQPSLAIGLGPHTDPNALTILYQDVSGLQVKKGDKWVAVKPEKDAFVVNVGDLLQALTNGRYISVMHRVVPNKDNARVSIAYFYGPDGDAEIQVPQELIDDDHPLKYRPFTTMAYNIFVTRNVNFREALDKFAGIQSVH